MDGRKPGKKPTRLKFHKSGKSGDLSRSSVSSTTSSESSPQASPRSPRKLLPGIKWPGRKLSPRSQVDELFPFTEEAAQEYIRVATEYFKENITAKNPNGLHVNFRDENNPNATIEMVVARKDPSAPIEVYYITKKKLGEGRQAAIHLTVNMATKEKAVAKITRPGYYEKGFLMEENLSKSRHLYLGSCQNINSNEPSKILLLPYFEMDLNKFLYKTNPQTHSEDPNFYLGKNELSLYETLEWSILLLEDLVEFHKLLHFHRDIKPSNILVNTAPFKKIKIVDYDTAIPFTQIGTIPGSPGYTDPEVCKATPFSAASDIFSLGVTLYELIEKDQDYLAYQSDQDLGKNLATFQERLLAKMKDLEQEGFERPLTAKEIDDLMLNIHSRKINPIPTTPDEIIYNALLELVISCTKPTAPERLQHSRLVLENIFFLPALPREEILKSAFQNTCIFTMDPLALYYINRKGQAVHIHLENQAFQELMKTLELPFPFEENQPSKIKPNEKQIEKIEALLIANGKFSRLKNEIRKLRKLAEELDPKKIEAHVIAPPDASSFFGAQPKKTARTFTPATHRVKAATEEEYLLEPPTLKNSSD